jgi:integrase
MTGVSKNELISLRYNEKSEENLPSITEASTYLHAATSNNTRRAYQSDIRHFIQWGGVLPTTPDVVMKYLHHYAQQLNPRTLVRRLTAIKNWHLFQEFPDPTAHSVVRKTLTGIKNVHGKPKEKAAPLTIQSLAILVAHLKESERLIDCRNSALLQIGFFGAFRRSELVAIRWEHISVAPEGIEILIPRSKTDQSSEGQICAIPYGNDVLCPIAALNHWKKRSNTESGYVFRRIMNDGQINSAAIKATQVNVMIKSIAKKCNLINPLEYSSHSLRRGFATEASKNGAPFGSIMRQGRWRHEGTVLGYIDEGKRFEQNAAGIMLKPI